VKLRCWFLLKREIKPFAVSVTPQSLMMRPQRAAQALAGHAHMQAVFGEVATESETLGD